MTVRFVVRLEAEADIDEAYAWYEDRTPGLGERFLEAVGEALAAIRAAPQRFPRVYEEPDISVRRALLGGFPYEVFFIGGEAQGTINVIGCLHARREPRHWRRRL